MHLLYVQILTSVAVYEDGCHDENRQKSKSRIISAWAVDEWIGATCIRANRKRSLISFPWCSELDSNGAVVLGSSQFGPVRVTRGG